MVYLNQLQGIHINSNFQKANNKKISSQNLNTALINNDTFNRQLSFKGKVSSSKINKWILKEINNSFFWEHNLEEAQKFGLLMSDIHSYIKKAVNKEDWHKEFEKELYEKMNGRFKPIVIEYNTIRYTDEIESNARQVRIKMGRKNKTIIERLQDYVRWNMKW